MCKVVQKGGGLSEAECTLRDAIHVFESIVSADRTPLADLRCDLANLYGGLSSIYERKHRFGRAADLYKKRESIYEQLIDGFPEKMKYRRTLIDAIRERIRWLSEKGNRKKAVDLRRSMFRMCDRIISKFPQLYGDLGHVLSDRRKDLKQEGNRPGLNALYNTECALLTKLLQRKDYEFDCFKRTEYQIDLFNMAVSCMRIAEWLGSQGSLEYAEQFQDEALDLCRKAVVRYPDDSLSRNCLPYCYSLKAQFSLSQRRFREAVDALALELRAYENNYPSITDHHPCGHSKATALYRYGILLSAAGQNKEASELIQCFWRLVDEDAIRYNVAMYGLSNEFLIGEILVSELATFAMQLESISSHRESKKVACDTIDLCEDVARQMPEQVNENNSVWLDQLPPITRDKIESFFQSKMLAKIVLGKSLKRTGHEKESQRIFSEVLREDSPKTGHINSIAWFLATDDCRSSGDVCRALKLAKQAVKIASSKRSRFQGLNTLGVAQYRAGQWKAAIQTLHEGMDLRADEGTSRSFFFLAMAHWQVGDKKEARQWYDKSVQWMQQYDPVNKELRRFRVEAAKLLGVELIRDIQLAADAKKKWVSPTKSRSPMPVAPRSEAETFFLHIQ